MTALPDRYEVRAGWMESTPLIGWLTFPREHGAQTNKEMSSPTGTQEAHHRSRKNALSEIPLFEYSPHWCEIGFSLGADLPLKLGKQKPLPGMRAFGFLKDRLPHVDLYSLLSTAALERAEGGLHPAAGKTELGAVRMPSSAIAYGGLIFYGENVPLEASQPVIHINDLAELVYAWHAWERGKNSPEETALLCAAGLSSDERFSLTLLSDRRPVTVTLPSVNDAYDVPFWRAFGLKMAKIAGIEVVDYALERRLGETVLKVARFDRQNTPVRRGVDTVHAAPKLLAAASASTLLMRFNPRTERPYPVSYLAMADILNREGAAPGVDLPKLWDRMAYTLLTNHAGDRAERWQFIHTELGWRPAPAHLLEWMPPAYGSRHATLTADGRKPLTDAEDAIALCGYFGLSSSDAKMRLMALRRALRDWEDIALADGASPNDLTLMAELFE